MKLANQDILNLVVLGMREQNRNAMEEGICVYRTDSDNPKESLRCAVGMLIPDENYSPRFEGCTIHAAMKDRPALWKVLGKIGVSEDNLDFLSSLQDWHDSVFEPDETFRREGVKKLEVEMSKWNSEDALDPSDQVNTKEALAFAKAFEDALAQSRKESTTHA